MSATIEGILISYTAFRSSITFGQWLRINVEEPSIELLRDDLNLDAATRRFLNACADHLGAKRPCEGPGLH